MAHWQLLARHQHVPHTSSVVPLPFLMLCAQGGAAKLADFAAQGAKVVEVDFSSEAELTAALQGVWVLRRGGGPGGVHCNGVVGTSDHDRDVPARCSCAGLETVISTVGTEGLLGQIEVIKAAKAAGVKRFVPSEFGLDTTAPGIRCVHGPRCDLAAELTQADARG